MGKPLFLNPIRTCKYELLKNVRLYLLSPTEDSATVILTKGKFYTGYAYFKKCYVSKGDAVTRGQIIGELFPYDSNFDNSLSLSIRKMEKDTSIVEIENQFKNK
jgi:hypothetical protein